MLTINILFFRWHKISPEGYRQVFTKIDKHHLCQLNNVILQNLSGLDLVRRSQLHVKGHRRGGVCVLRMLLVLNFVEWYLEVIHVQYSILSIWFTTICVFYRLKDAFSYANMNMIIILNKDYQISKFFTLRKND